MAGHMSSLAELKRSRELLINLTLRDVRSRYKRTVFGNAWSLVNPLAAMLIYTMVFGFFLRIQPSPGDPSGLDVFALWLLCGLLPWTFLSNAMGVGMTSLLDNANLVMKVYLPRSVLVASAVLALGVTFLIEMAVLSGVILGFGNNVLLKIPIALGFMILLALFALGLGLGLSVLNVYFRDTQHFVAIFLQIWFYLTPILYPLTYVQQAQDRLAADGHDVPLVTLFKLNPAEHYVSVFRNLLYDNRMPSVTDLGACLLAAVVALVLGGWIFRTYEGRLAEEL
jgi:ABC-type polysaccharide/polyol phosphate export permease